MSHEGCALIRFPNGKPGGLLARCEEWHLWPVDGVYTLCGKTVLPGSIVECAKAVPGVIFILCDRCSKMSDALDALMEGAKR